MLHISIYLGVNQLSIYLSCERSFIFCPQLFLEG